MDKRKILEYSTMFPSGSILVASGAMTMQGLIRRSNDIDLIVSRYGFDELSSRPGAVLVEKWFGPCILLGPIEATTSPFSGVKLHWENKDGILVQTPCSILELYLSLNRPKDQEKLKILRSHLSDCICY